MVITTFKRFAFAFAFACIALIALPSMAHADVAISEETFPDANFRTYVQDTLNGGNPVLADATIEGITSIDVTGKQIESLAGIGYFTELTHLDCKSNELTSLDLSKNTKLTQLFCQTNELTSLNISGITGLTVFYCFDNQLTSLDVSANPGLASIFCYNNQLASLNVDGVTALSVLYCDNNKLTTLDFSTNASLFYLDCSTNLLYDVVLGSASPSIIEGYGQNLAVPVAFDQAANTYRSKQPFPLDGSHTLAFGNAAISYENGFIQSDDPSATGSFTTSLGSGKTLTGAVALSVGSFTVSFVDWDGTPLKTETVEEGKAATAPADPSRQGHIFTGWDADFSNVVSDLAVNALYDSIEWKSWWVDGIDTHTKETGKTLTLASDAPFDPATGVVIDGVPATAKDAALSEAPDGTTLVTLSASFLDGLSTKEHAISLEFPDGSFAQNAFRILDGEPAPEPDPTPTPEPSPAPNDGTPKPLSDSGSKELATTGDAIPWQILLIVPAAAAILAPIARKKMQ